GSLASSGSSPSYGRSGIGSTSRWTSSDGPLIGLTPQQGTDLRSPPCGREQARVPTRFCLVRLHQRRGPVAPRRATPGPAPARPGRGRRRGASAWGWARAYLLGVSLSAPVGSSPVLLAHRPWRSGPCRHA